MDTSNSLHGRFLVLLPRIEAHAKSYFRGIRCPAKKADRIAETIGLAWRSFVMLAKRGKDACLFATTFVRFAVRSVQCGRRVAGKKKSKEIYNRATRRHGDFVRGPLADALVDSTATTPPDAAAFRIDFPRWLQSLPTRARSMAEELMVGERTLDVARRFGVSAARVSQVRRKLAQDWAAYHGEEMPAECR